MNASTAPHSASPRPADERVWGDATSLAHAVAEATALRLQHAIAQRGRAVLAVSGGKSPIPVFTALRDAPLDWSRVRIHLVDERCVPSTHADSNTALVRQHLLQGAAARASFVTLFNDADLSDAFTPSALDDLAHAASARITPLGVPDVALLGMGEDGHTASLFPNAPGLETALTQRGPIAWVCPSTAPHPRLTLTLPALLAARHLLLSFSGASKRAVWHRASRGPQPALPVSLVRHHAASLAVWFA
ncbi:MAG: 6-phosphogluconolactonase [Pseudomonadota bacterium]|jgi:6-phosphogluconolactonase